jgi:hypothetical protein
MLNLVVRRETARILKVKGKKTPITHITLSTNPKPQSCLQQSFIVFGKVMGSNMGPEIGYTEALHYFPKSLQTAI